MDRPVPQRTWDWVEPAYDPYREQDLQPWERDYENRYSFDPESEEAA